MAIEIAYILYNFVVGGDKIGDGGVESMIRQSHCLRREVSSELGKLCTDSLDLLSKQSLDTIDFRINQR